jgi:NADH dehydrogenase
VLVEPDLSIPGDPRIFAIGDLAAFLHQTGAPLPGVAPVAIQQGRHVAASIGADLAGRPRTPFHYRDKGSLAVLGRARAVALFGKVEMSGLLAWLAWCFVHILFLIGFRNRLVVLFEWAWAYLTSKRAARLITGSIDRTRA